MSKKIITLCSSANFYKHVGEIADELENRGYKVIIPRTAEIMRKSGDYDVAKVKTWIKNKDDLPKKRKLMDGHFAEVEKADAILVVNDEKHGTPGYIGPNGLMEMALAYYLKKPIYILNSVKNDSNIYEEVYGMGNLILDGDISKIKL